MFREKLGLEYAYDLNNILTRDQPYINNEEELLDEDVKKGQGAGYPGNSQEQWRPIT